MNLRKELRNARRSLSADQQEEHAAAVSEHLLRSNLFVSASCVAVYLCSDGEVDLSPVIDELYSRGVKLVAPRIEGSEMRFLPFNPSETHSQNQWGIREPKIGAHVDETEMSVALVPLVAFTDEGNRLGRGKGFYDRYFNGDETLLIGIGHELQRVESMETKAWDRRLDAVVTERGWRICSCRAKASLAPKSGDIR